MAVAGINLLTAFMADTSVQLSGPILSFMQSLELVEKSMIIILLGFILVTEFRIQKSNKKKWT